MTTKFDLEKFRNGHPAKYLGHPAYFVAEVPELGQRPVVFRVGGTLYRCFLDGSGAGSPLTLDDPPPKRRPYQDLSEVPVGHWFRQVGTDTEPLLYRVQSLNPRPLGVDFGGGVGNWSAKGLAENWEHAPGPTGPWEPCTVEET